MTPLYGLQMIRAFACWLVFVHHFSQSFYQFGYDNFLGYFITYYGGFGVDIFFVLSGFVMYLSAEKYRNNARHFFLNRVFRVVPAYWFYTLLLIPALYCFPELKQLTDYDKETLVKSLLFLSSENPAGIGRYPLLTVGWTLNFEMLFYALVSLSILCFHKYWFVICLSALLLFPHVWGNTWPMGDLLNSFLLYEFALGLLLSWLYVRLSRLGYMPLNAQSIALLTLVSVVTAYNFDRHFMYKILFAGSLIMFAVLMQTIIVKRFRYLKGLLALGDYSYSTYLLHSSILVIFLYGFGRPAENWASKIAYLLLMSVIAAVISFYSYRYIENNKYLSWLKKLCVRYFAASTSAFVLRSTAKKDKARIY